MESKETTIASLQKTTLSTAFGPLVPVSFMDDLKIIIIVTIIALLLRNPSINKSGEQRIEKRQNLQESLIRDRDRESGSNKSNSVYQQMREEDNLVYKDNETEGWRDFISQ